jgi:hypothetical protein
VYLRPSLRCCISRRRLRSVCLASVLPVRWALSEHQEALRGGRRGDRGGVKNWGSKYAKPSARSEPFADCTRPPRRGVGGTVVARAPAREQRLTRRPPGRPRRGRLDAATSLTGAGGTACDAHGAYTRHRRVRPASLPYWPLRAHARLPRAVAGGVSGVSSRRPLGTRLPDDKSSLFVFMQQQPKQN